MVNKKSKQKNHISLAFTLVEALLAISIIGIIAAFTIPTLLNNVNKAGYTNSFRAAYSVLMNATNQILTDNGYNLKNAFHAPSDVRDAYASKVKTIKNCDYDSFFEDCWYPEDDIKSLNGWPHLDRYNDVVDDFRVGGEGLQLANGMLLFFNVTWGFASDCSNMEDGIGPECMTLWVDTNGYKKPDTLGRDIFIFILNEKTLLPWGNVSNNNHYCDSNTQDSWNGMECALRLATEGEMNY